MKKNLILLVLMMLCLIGTDTAQAQNTTAVGQSEATIEQLFKDYEKEEGVTKITLPKSMIAMGAQQADSKEAAEAMKQIDRMTIMSLESAPKSVKKKLTEQIKSLSLTDYKDMVTTNEGTETTRILVKGDDKEIQSILVMAVDDEDCALIKIDGHISAKNLNGLVSSMTE